MNLRMTAALLLAFGIIVTIAAGPAADAAENGGDLSRAYKKEFAFLEAERANLAKRLEAVRREGKTSVRQAESDIIALQNTLLGLSARADDLNEQIIGLERQGERSLEATEIVASTLMQAANSLEKYGITVPQPENDDMPATLAALDTAFGRAHTLLLDLRRIRTEPGAFYLQDGSLVKGDLLRIGNVAAYGISSQGGGALAPAGGGKLKVWEPAGLADAKAIQSGRDPGTVGMFLYDNADKAIEKKAGKTVGEVIESGGVIAWVIVFLGLAALLMIVLRTWFLFRSSSRTDILVGHLAPLIREGWRDEALSLCRRTSGATSRVLAATIRNLHEDRQQLEDRISEAILHETPYLDRFGSIILVFAAVAPLLGLLGTVTGMISTFDIITEFGTGDPKLLSGGISEALVTTELGLIVAIPTLLFGNLLTGWANRIKAGMEHAALLITNIYKSRGEEKTDIAAETDTSAVSAEASVPAGAGAEPVEA